MADESGTRCMYCRENRVKPGGIVMLPFADDAPPVKHGRLVCANCGLVTLVDLAIFDRYIQDAIRQQDAITDRQ